jgi:hypothetical protein
MLVGCNPYKPFVPRSPRSPFPPKRLTLGKQSKSMASFPTHDPHQLSIVRKVLSVLPASPRRGVIGVRRDHRRARTSSGAVSSALLRGPRRGLSAAPTRRRQYAAEQDSGAKAEEHKLRGPVVREPRERSFSPAGAPSVPD